MTHLKIENGRLHRLVERVHHKRRTIAELSAVLFLSGGGVLFLTAVLFAGEAFTALSIQGPLTGIPAFGGIILTYVGLLSLHGRFENRPPRLASVGFFLVALPTLVIAVLTVWGIAHHLPIGTVPSPIQYAPIGGVLMLIAILFSVGVGLYGVAYRQTDAPSGHIGLLLLVLAATWLGLFTVMSIYGSRLPAWLDFITVGTMAVAVIGIGTSLRAGGPTVADPE